MTESNLADQPLTPDAPAADRLDTIVERLRAAHPDAHCALDYQTPWQLLVATILSAQTTDERVNQVTPALFARYPDTAAMAAADRNELEELIRPTGFFRQKARYIHETSQRLVAEHDGQVPGDLQALLQMSGVARKTANVVLGEIFNVAEGVVVDTHVKRLAQRLGLVQATTAEKIEEELMELLPRELWIEISHLLIFHGRRICAARKPDCANCPLLDLCPSAVV
ncbi:MAG: endonuclease III [Anaerolineae bacterium]|nr:endonuclease III [Anaerolineae bacterium]